MRSRRRDTAQEHPRQEEQSEQEMRAERIKTGRKLARKLIRDPSPIYKYSNSATWMVMCLQTFHRFRDRQFV